MITHIERSLMGGCVSPKYIVLTKVQVEADKVRLRTTVSIVNDRREWQHHRKKTVPVRDWEIKSQRWHEEIIQGVIEVQ